MSGITNLLGLKSPYQQVVTVAKAGGDYTTITDAASDRIYTVLVFPGSYDGFILRDYVNVVALDHEATVITSEVSDDNDECHCYLSLNIASTSGNGLRTENAATVVKEQRNLTGSDPVTVKQGRTLSRNQNNKGQWF